MIVIHTKTPLPFFFFLKRVVVDFKLSESNCEKGINSSAHLQNSGPPSYRGGYARNRVRCNVQIKEGHCPILYCVGLYLVLGATF